MCAQCSEIMTDCSYYQLGQSCVTSCPIDTYIDDKDVCQPCHVECDGGCSGSSARNCTQCRHFSMEKTDECVTECPDGYLPNPTKTCFKNQRERKRIETIMNLISLCSLFGLRWSGQRHKKD